MSHDIESADSELRRKEESLKNRVDFWFSASEDESHQYFETNKTKICRSFTKGIMKPIKDITWPLLFEVKNDQRIKINQYIVDKLSLHLAHVSGDSELLYSQDVDYEGSFIHWFRLLLVIPDLSIGIIDVGKSANRTTSGSSSSSAKRMLDNFPEFHELPVSFVEQLTDDLEAHLMSKITQISWKKLSMFYQTILPSMRALESDLMLSDENSEKEIQRLFDVRFVTPVVKLMRFIGGIEKSGKSYTRRYNLRCEGASSIHPDILILSENYENNVILEMKAPYLLTKWRREISEVFNYSDRSLILLFKQLLQYAIHSHQDQILISDLKVSLFIKLLLPFELPDDGPNKRSIKIEVLEIKNYFQRDEKPCYTGNVLETRTLLALMIHRANKGYSNIMQRSYKNQMSPILDLLQSEDGDDNSQDLGYGQSATRGTQRQGSRNYEGRNQYQESLEPIYQDILGQFSDSLYSKSFNVTTLPEDIRESKVISDPVTGEGFTKVIRLPVSSFKELFGEDFVISPKAKDIIVKIYSRKLIEGYLCTRSFSTSIEQVNRLDVLETEEYVFQRCLPTEIDTNLRIMEFNSQISDPGKRINAPELYGFGILRYENNLDTEPDFYLAFQAIDDIKISNRDQFADIEKELAKIHHGIHVSHGDITYDNVGYHNDGKLYLLDFNKALKITDDYEAEEYINRDLEKLESLVTEWDLIQEYKH